MVLDLDDDVPVIIVHRADGWHIVIPYSADAQLESDDVFPTREEAVKAFDEWAAKKGIPTKSVQ